MLYDLSRVPMDLQQTIMESPKYMGWFNKFPSKLFGRDTNHKTVKGQKIGISTEIIYQMPSSCSGYQVCGMEYIAGCKEVFLNEAGRCTKESVQFSRLRKTLYFFQYRREFIEQLKREVIVHAKWANKKGMIPAVRPNGTSDILWELYIWDFMCETSEKYRVKWYDYTKKTNRLIPDPDIYDLTFSYSNRKEYQPFVEKAAQQGMRMAGVFRNEYNIPKEFMGLKCIDGDATDVRFLDPMNAFIALKAKGKARKDMGEFVINN